MVVEVDEVPAAQKPCFYQQAGLPKGAYLRVGNTNRQMTEYEVFGYLSSRGQPTHDEDPVVDATLDDLHSELLDEYLAQLRHARPRASFLDGLREEVLVRLHVLHRNGDVIRPTLAGLLTFVQHSGLITNTECRALLNVDEARAYYLLKKLSNVRRLRPDGKGKGRRYLLP